jgi:hypothetical protein
MNSMGTARRAVHGSPLLNVNEQSSSFLDLTLALSWHHLQLQVELEVSGRNFLPCAQAHAVPEL